MDRRRLAYRTAAVLMGLVVYAAALVAAVTLLGPGPGQATASPTGVFLSLAAAILAGRAVWRRGDRPQ